MAKIVIELIDKVTGVAKRQKGAVDDLAKAAKEAEKRLAASAKEVEKRQRAQDKVIAQAQRASEKVAKDETRQRDKRAKDEQRLRDKAAKAADRESDKDWRDAIKAAKKKIADKERAQAAAQRKTAAAAEKARKEEERAQAAHQKRIDADAVASGMLRVELMKKAGRMALDGAKAFAHMSMTAQADRFQFAAVAGDVGLGNAQLKHADALAIRYGQSVAETRKEYRDLVDLELGAKDIDVFERLAASARASGQEGDVNGMIQALAKVRVKGVLDSTSLRSLGQAGVQRTHLLSALGEHLGLGKDATEEQLSATLDKKGAGKTKGLQSDIALPLIQKAIMAGIGESTPGELAAKRADTTAEGRGAVARARLETKGLELGDKLSPVLTGLLTEIDEGVQRIDTKVLAESLTTLIGITKVGFKIGEGVLDTVTGAIGKVVFSVTDAQENAAALKARNTEAGVAGPSSLRSGFNKVVSSGAGMLAGAAASLPLTPVGGVMVGRQVQQYVQAKLDGAAAGDAYAEGMSEGMLNGQAKVEASAASLAAAPVETVNTEMEIHSPSRVGFRQGEYYAEGVALGQESNASRVAQAGAGLSNAAQIGMSGGKGGSGGGGSRRLVLDVNVTGSGSMTSPDGSELMPAIREGVLQLLRETSIELGLELE